MPTRVLIIGAYGNFGARLTRALCAAQTQGDLHLILAGRDLARGRALAGALSGASIEARALDVGAASFTEDLRKLTPDIVVHTAGPFQGQAFSVARACIDAGAHYVDLADDRAFVTGIGELDDAAKARGVLVLSGASSVPGLSCVIVEQFARDFERLDEIDIAIVPGNRSARGKATVRGILSYVGQPFSTWRGGASTDVHGWMDVRRIDFGHELGRRWLANVDVPDTALLPKLYRDVQTVRFQAGLELGLLHNAMLLMAALARAGLVKDWSRYTDAIFSLSRLFDLFGTDVGGMRVSLRGQSREHGPLETRWTLVAEHDAGPNIPIVPALICVVKLAAGELDRVGAMPCLGLFGLDEFSQAIKPWPIRHRVERLRG